MSTEARRASIPPRPSTPPGPPAGDGRRQSQGSGETDPRPGAEREDVPSARGSVTPGIPPEDDLSGPAGPAGPGGPKAPAGAAGATGPARSWSVSRGTAAAAGADADTNGGAGVPRVSRPDFTTGLLPEDADEDAWPTPPRPPGRQRGGTASRSGTASAWFGASPASTPPRPRTPDGAAPRNPMGTASPQHPPRFPAGPPAGAPRRTAETLPPPPASARFPDTPPGGTGILPRTDGASTSGSERPASRQRTPLGGAGGTGVPSGPVTEPRAPFGGAGGTGVPPRPVTEPRAPFGGAEWTSAPPRPAGGPEPLPGSRRPGGNGTVQSFAGRTAAPDEAAPGTTPRPRHLPADPPPAPAPGTTSPSVPAPTPPGRGPAGPGESFTGQLFPGESFPGPSRRLHEPPEPVRRPFVSLADPDIHDHDTAHAPPTAPRRRSALAAAAACAVLGLGLIGGAVTGSRLTGDEPGAAEAPDAFTAAGDLWHTVPVDTLFPPTVEGEGAGPGGADRAWTRIAVAPDSGCTDAFDPLLRRALAPAGCSRLLRATYTDATRSHVTTVGLLFTKADSAAMAALHRRFEEQGLDGRRDLMPRPYAAKGTVAAGFGDRQRASWTLSVLTDAPVVAYAVSGFADGRTVTDPQSAEDAMKAGATAPAAQAGLGHDAQGLADRIERSLRRTADPATEKPS